MTEFNHTAFYAQLRKDMGPLKQPQVDMFNRALAAGAGMATSVLPWIAAGMAKLGEREIVGPKNNNWIVNGWARLGAGWFKDDETPWCGFFVAHCIDAAGLPIPKGGAFAQAAAWATWGEACAPQLGAVGVKKRTGGNHVFFIVGITADGKFYKALGGNQGNAVSIIDIPVGDVFATRWPAGVPQTNTPLPIMATGTVNASEA